MCVCGEARSGGPGKGSRFAFNIKISNWKSNQTLVIRNSNLWAMHSTLILHHSYVSLETDDLIFAKINDNKFLCSCVRTEQ